MRRHYDALSAARWPALALQVIHAPVFHGHTISIAIELERAVDISALEEALSGDHVDLVLEDTDSPSNLAATGQNDVLVRLRPEGGQRNPNQGLAPLALGRFRQSPPSRAKCGRVRSRPAPAPAQRHRAVVNARILCLKLVAETPLSF